MPQKGEEAFSTTTGNWRQVGRIRSRHLARIAAAAVSFGALAVTLVGCGGGHTQGLKPVWTVAGHSPDELVRYWTSERMARAEPYEPGLTNSAAGGHAALRYQSHAWGSGPVTKEGARAVGKVFFEERGVAYFCLGTAIASDNASTVVTAGHCAADAGTCAKGGDCRPHQNWIFVPAYREDASCSGAAGAGCPYGRYAAKMLFAPPEWLADGNHRYDFAAVVVEARDKEFAVASTAGAIPIVFNVAPKTVVGRGFTVFGYPKGAPFNGRLWVCAANGAARNDSRYEWFRGSSRTGSEPGPAELMTGCNMTGGADGGPWLTTQNGTTVLVSVSSFSPAGHRTTVSGPYLGEVAKRVYELAADTKVES
jgi:hypothetical protein